MAKKTAKKAVKPPAAVKVAQKKVQKAVTKANVKNKINLSKAAPSVAKAAKVVSASGLGGTVQAAIAKVTGGGARAYGGGRRKSPVASIKRRIKSALFRQARYQVGMGQPMRAAKTLRKRFRVI